MQKVAFTRFGVGRGQESAANLGAADFTTAKNSGKIGLLRGIMQGKATNLAVRATNGGEIHGAKGVEFTATQGKAINSVARAAQSVAKMGARVINSTPSKAANSVFSGVRAVFALSRARVSSLSLSLSRSLFGAF